MHYHAFHIIGWLTGGIDIELLLENGPFQNGLLLSLYALLGVMFLCGMLLGSLLVVESWYDLVALVVGVEL